MRFDLGNPEGLLLCKIEPSVDLWRDAAYAAQAPGMHTAAHPCRQSMLCGVELPVGVEGVFLASTLSPQRGWGVLCEIRATGRF